MRARAAAILDLLLPRVCVCCEAAMGDGILCGVCWARLHLLPAPQCERCGHPRGEGPCTYCALLPAYVRSARSVCWMSHPSARAAVHALKYDGWSATADAMAERMARLSWPRDVVEERAAVIPVPLAPARLRERGYNQAALLAAPLARRWRIPVFADILERTRHTSSQTRLSPSERALNVTGAFRVVAGGAARLRGAHVVVVDDVLTTGATLNAAADALFAAGARIVSYVTFGRARSSAD